MELSAKQEDRKKFMNRKLLFCRIISPATFDNPLKRRENFSVSLRKKRHDEIIQTKRRNRNEINMPDFSSDQEMNGFPENIPWLHKMKKNEFFSQVESLVPGICSQADTVSA